jgi:hypothetical protein
MVVDPYAHLVRVHEGVVSYGVYNDLGVDLIGDVGNEEI